MFLVFMYIICIVLQICFFILIQGQFTINTYNIIHTKLFFIILYLTGHVREFVKITNQI